MGSINEKFLTESLLLIEDKEINLGVFAKYRLTAYAEEYSKKIKDNPERAKRILQKIYAALTKVLK